jgi:hypothetical protein
MEHYLFFIKNFFFEAGSCYFAQAYLKLGILLPQSVCWDYRCAISGPQLLWSTLGKLLTKKHICHFRIYPSSFIIILLWSFLLLWILCETSLSEFSDCLPHPTWTLVGYPCGVLQWLLELFLTKVLLKWLVYLCFGISPQSPYSLWHKSLVGALLSGCIDWKSIERLKLKDSHILCFLYWVEKLTADS